MLAKRHSACTSTFSTCMSSIIYCLSSNRSTNDLNPQFVLRDLTYSSSLVTLAHLSTSSSLQIMDYFFQYASRHLWNQLPNFLHQPHTNLSGSNSTLPITVTSCSTDSPLSSSITSSLFHSRLKNFLFLKYFPPQPFFFYDTIRDAILMCARKPTWVDLIYRMETTTKIVKQKK